MRHQSGTLGPERNLRGSRMGILSFKRRVRGESQAEIVASERVFNGVD